MYGQDGLDTLYGRAGVAYLDGGDGSGKNRLGQLLMKLREELRAEAAPGKPGAI